MPPSLQERNGASLLLAPNGDGEPTVIAAGDRLDPDGDPGTVVVSLGKDIIKI